MAKQDQITKRKKRVANNVSHSKRRTKRTQEINLQYKRFYIEEQKRWVKLQYLLDPFVQFPRLVFLLSQKIMA